jgi:cyclase
MDEAGGRTSTQSAMTEVADGIFVYTQLPGGWCVSNSGVIVSGTDTMLVDTLATEARTRDLAAAIEGRGIRTPNLIVTTHHHGDHHFGNFVFSDTATVVGHENTRTQVVAAGLGMCNIWPDVEWGDVVLQPPQITYTSTHVIEGQGGRRVELHHLGTAHTDNDTVVWLPEERVLFLGDIAFPAAAPYVLFGSVRGSIAALERMLEWDPVTVVPGHGSPGGMQIIHDTLEYFEWIEEEAHRAVESGLSYREAAATLIDEPRFRHLSESERLVSNLAKGMSEIRGVAPSDQATLASFRDMCDFHGGVPASLA